ncbi:MAG: hypothetical protein H8D22_12615 [Candidatus Cloacimonetes bacterium]|nr:hypothetical protein [Candidatus Cloacimonadota bacterium]
MSEENNKIKYPRGSEWRKWDIHIHSPLSILNNQYPKLANGNPDWEAFVKKLESLDVAVVGITDYFTIDGYKKLKEFKKRGQLTNIHTILPNIEFRLKSLLSSKKDGEKPKRLNFHIIFSDEVSIKDIEEHFLHDIYFYYEEDPENDSERRKLKLSNIEELGKKLLNHHKAFRRAGHDPITLGAMQAVVNHEDITKILANDSRFRGKYVVVLPEEGWYLIDWDGQDHHTRKTLLQSASMVFSSNHKTCSWCLGKEPYLEGEKHFIKEFITLKPCIHGSDAHKLEEVGHPCALRGDNTHKCDDNPNECQPRYCWVKADPTFEGFKQLLYEPEERVIVQEKDPSPIISNYTISEVDISDEKINNELSLKKTNIALNTALVAVVGGKGTGKTALVDIVANCYMDRCNTDDKNSFVRRIINDDPKIETKLLFRDGGEFSKQLTDQNFLDEGQFFYIAQGKLEKYIGEGSDLDKYINNLIFESPQIRNSIKTFEFGDLVEKSKNFIEKIVSKNQLIEKIEQKTSLEIYQSIKQEQRKNSADIKDIENRIKELEKVQSKKNIELAQEKQKNLGELKSRRDDLVGLRDAIKNSINFLEDQVLEFNENIIIINELLKKLNIKEKYDKLSYVQCPNLDSRLKTTKKEIEESISEIEKAQKELDRFERGIQEHTKLLDRKRELIAGSKKIEARIKQFKEEKKRLEQVVEERKGLMKESIENIVAQKKKYKEIIKMFSSKKADVLADLNFVAEIRFDADGLLKKAESIMDNRKINIDGDDNTPPAFDKIIKLYSAIVEGDENRIGDLIKEIERCYNELKSKIKSYPISTGDFYNFLYGNYMRVVPVVKYKKTDLEKLSLGQKATILIKIYLAQGDKPIIIDSHDDHLDNEFIMDELVKAIRQAKSYRQVILVSNNGNVVINSDAEQIIVANINKGEISYIAGAIENPKIRDRALEVLEGGSEAFRKRQQKYRINT